MDSDLRSLSIPIIFLRNELKLLEKSRKYFFSKLKVENPELGTQLLEEAYALDTLRSHDNMKTETKFAEINCTLRQIQKDFHKVAEPDFTSFRQITLRLEGKISSLKKEKEQRLRKLQSDLKDSEKYLQYKLERAALYEDMRYHQKHSSLVSKEKLKKLTFEHEDFGGWEEEDHNLFKELYNMYGPITAANMTTSLLPDMTESDVLEYAEWYSKVHKTKQEENKNWHDKIRKSSTEHKLNVLRKKRSKSCSSIHNIKCCKI